LRGAIGRELRRKRENAGGRWLSDEQIADAVYPFAAVAAQEGYKRGAAEALKEARARIEALRSVGELLGADTLLRSDVLAALAAPVPTGSEQ
jgi:predicted metal-dependent hydrolase